MRRLMLLLAVTCLTGPLATAPGAAAGQLDRPKPVDVQLLAINDFHGNLEATGTRPTDTGGAEYLATHVDRLSAQNPKATTIVSAGDLIGASPLLSALFHDEPTIEAMNLIGLDYNAVGNHEFDDGAAELRRMQEGGCHPADGCQDGDGFEGAQFRFLAANVLEEASGRTFLPAYGIEKYRGEKVAFIGMTLEDTPSVVSPSGVAGLDFRDEADTVNALVPRLKRLGAEAIVVLVHEGGRPVANGECVSGAINDIVRRTSKEVDLFITGHTHQAYDCVVDGRPVTSAGQYGRLVTEIDLRIDRRTGEPFDIRADNRPVTRDVGRDPRLTELIAKYDAQAAPLRDRVIGSTAEAITRASTPAGESALGDVIADAQLEATRSNGAQVAFMNPGGIRQDLDAGDVTYGEAFSVQPFGNTLTTMTLSGAQLRTLLEQQVGGANDTRNRMLQPSAGLTYAVRLIRDASGAVVDRVIVQDSVRLAGEPLTDAANYRVTVNSFLADGGDGFAVLKEGTGRVGGGLDLDAFEAFFSTRSPVAPGPRNRITVAS